MMLTRANRSTRKETCPRVTLSTTNSNVLDWDQMRFSAVRGQELIPGSIARPKLYAGFYQLCKVAGK